MREGRKVSCCRIIGIVIAEDEAISHSVMIAVFDHTERGLGDEEFFEPDFST